MHLLMEEMSGGAAKRNLQAITIFNRVRGSRDFHAAAEYVLARARENGLTDAHVERFPADGKRFYGALKARQAWDADSADLWEVLPKKNLRPRGAQTAPLEFSPLRRICSWEDMRVCLAEDSESADVTAELIDVGSGTNEKDYEGKETKGKIVLISSQGGAAQKLAVDRFGAVGMVSYALNQLQGWQGEDDSLVRWGHLDSYSPTRTFAFQVSLRQARDFQSRLAQGEKIWLRARVKAGRHDGFYEVVTGTLPGSDERLKNEEIVFSCHLDHHMPGANDNASGCAAILEVARTMHRLIEEKSIPPLKRTLRFVWPAEIEGTQIFLFSHPELAAKMKAAIHMDMVGGSQEKTKALFHVTRTPDSIPSFVNDVAQVFGEYVRDLSDQFAATGEPRFAVHAPDGSKDALHLEISEYTEGSDHQVYDEGSFRIPTIYLNDWPDRYIHTNEDSVDKIDTTKLKRAATVGAASGYFLANLDSTNSAVITSEVVVHAKRRMADSQARFSEQASLAARASPRDPLREMDNFLRYLVQRERANFISLRSFIGEEQVAKFDLIGFTRDLIGWSGVRGDEVDSFLGELEPKEDTGEVPTRLDLKGAMSLFGYDYLADHYGVGPTTKLKIFANLDGLPEPTSPLRRASSSDYTYEILNLVDGKRSVQAIRDFVSAEFGPIPLEWVREYLKALEAVKVIQFSNQ
ncbi:MAG: M28 family peptidase [Acidobacteriia bacterium]|nr:M28 family peptidase [Terriglobia bacterium]